MKAYLIGAAVLVLVGCAPGRVKQYNDMLDPMLGSGTRSEIDVLLGKPKQCEQDRSMYRCEYRTAGQGEAMVKDAKPGTFTPFAGREIAEQQNSDVLHLWFDYRGKLKEWKPTAIMP